MVVDKQGNQRNSFRHNKIFAVLKCKPIKSGLCEIFPPNNYSNQHFNESFSDSKAMFSEQRRLEEVRSTLPLLTSVLETWIRN